MSQRKHQPERFEVYKELSDGSGFTIPQCKHIFKFDKYYGWFDQFDNYYDKNGSPADPPSPSEHSDDDYSPSDRSDQYDEFEKEFGKPKNYDDVEDDHSHLIYYGKIADNL